MNEIRIGSRTLQPRRQLLAGGGRVPLGKRALEILSALAEARGAIVTKDELLEAVWPGVIVEEGAITVHLVALRKALGPEADRLQTIRGVGYQLRVDNGLDEPPAAPAAAAASPSRGGAMGAWLASLWPQARAPRLALVLVGLLLVLAGVWATFGTEFGRQPPERIPVVVRALAATTKGDRAEAGLASGITDELISRLRRVPELRIATAAPDGTVPGGKFDDAYVIDGNIRTDGDRVRVTTRLVDASGELLWSETFDRNLVDLFDVQGKIAAAIATALSVSFDVGANSTRYGGTDNPEAHAAYMQSWAHSVDLDPSIPRRYLEHAARLDPDFGMVLYGLTTLSGRRSVSKFGLWRCGCGVGIRPCLRPVDAALPCAAGHDALSADP